MRYEIIQVAYLIATALFIFALHWMNHPATARKGVYAGVAAMTVAVLGTLLYPGLVNWKWMAVAAALGVAVGVPLSWIPLTAVPQRTALSHAFGGLAAALALRALPGPDPVLPGLAGAGIALAFGLPLFALRGLGGGDVKLLAAVGAFLGPGRLITALLAAGVAGGVLAVAVALRRGVLLPALLGTGGLLRRWATLGRAGERRTLASPGAITVPYGVAIAVGAVVGWFLSPLGGG